MPRETNMPPKVSETNMRCQVSETNMPREVRLNKTDQTPWR